MRKMSTSIASIALSGVFVAMLACNGPVALRTEEGTDPNLEFSNRTDIENSSTSSTASTTHESDPPASITVTQAPRNCTGPFTNICAGQRGNTPRTPVLYQVYGFAGRGAGNPSGNPWRSWRGEVEPDPKVSSLDCTAPTIAVDVSSNTSRPSQSASYEVEIRDPDGTVSVRGMSRPGDVFILHNNPFTSGNSWRFRVRVKEFVGFEAGHTAYSNWSSGATISASSFRYHDPPGRQASSNNHTRSCTATPRQPDD